VLHIFFSYQQLPLFFVYGVATFRGVVVGPARHVKLLTNIILAS
jgi:hypothetical protein